MDRKPVAGSVKFNYQTTKSKYFILTDKTGYPSAEFRSQSGNGLIVAHHTNSSADPPGI